VGHLRPVLYLLERLANVIYWTASTIALLLLAWCAWAFQYTPERERPTLLVGVGVAVVVWLIGRAVRYVLAGK